MICGKDSNNMKKEKIINNIVLLEWDMFNNVTNIGKRAYCQDMKGNFIFSRKAYWNIYNEDILNSYLSDLKKANKEHISLVSLKYAFMMQLTDEEYFKKIEEKLVPISEKKKLLIELIMLICRQWLENIATSNIYKGYRKLFSKEDSVKNTSVETYLYGEYMSYSTDTIFKIFIYIIEKYYKNINLLQENLLNLENKVI